MAYRRTCLGIYIAVLLSTPRIAAAQDAVHSLAGLSGAVPAGTRIVVIGSMGAVIDGTLVRIAAGTITVKVIGPRSERTVDLTEAEVKEVRKETWSVSWLAVPVGAGLGFAIGY